VEKDKIVEIVGSWAPLLRDEFKEPYMMDLHKQIQHYKGNLMGEFFPKTDMFEVFKKTPMGQLKVVYIVDDPEFNPEHLHSIEHELRKGFDVNLTCHNDYWWLHEQGVMFLPRYLSKGIEGLHAEWKLFTDKVILNIATASNPDHTILFVTNNASIRMMLDYMCPNTEIIGKLGTWNYIDSWIKLNHNVEIDWSPPINSQISQ
jgi:uracil DNA glycosylase